MNKTPQSIHQKWLTDGLESAAEYTKQYEQAKVDKRAAATARFARLSAEFHDRANTGPALDRLDSACIYLSHFTAVWKGLQTCLTQTGDDPIMVPGLTSGESSVPVAGFAFYEHSKQASDVSRLYAGEYHDGKIDRNNALTMSVLNLGGVRAVAGIHGLRSAEATFTDADDMRFPKNRMAKRANIRAAEEYVVQLDTLTAEATTTNLQAGQTLLRIYDASGWDDFIDEQVSKSAKHLHKACDEYHKKT